MFYVYMCTYRHTQMKIYVKLHMHASNHVRYAVPSVRLYKPEVPNTKFSKPVGDPVANKNHKT